RSVLRGETTTRISKYGFTIWARAAPTSSAMTPLAYTGTRGAQSCASRAPSQAGAFCVNAALTMRRAGFLGGRTGRRIRNPRLVRRLSGEVAQSRGGADQS